MYLKCKENNLEIYTGKKNIKEISKDNTKFCCKLYIVLFALGKNLMWI